MSREYPCIYFEKDGKCRKFSDDYRFVSYCVMGACPEQKLSNADRIRAMSDEDLAVFLCSVKFRRESPLNVPDFLYIKDAYDWLQQPAEEDT